MSIPEKLIALRNELKKESIDALFITGSDPHQSEYVAQKWQDRLWISGFTGSAGYIVVTNDHAGLWTDGRYFTQAEEELKGTGFVLHKLGQPQTLDPKTWLLNNLNDNSVVSVDGYDMSLNQYLNFNKAFKSKKITLNTSIDIIDNIWDKRPILPTNEIFDFDVIFAGATREDKIKIIKDAISINDADYMLITALDEIAWALNIRGSDVESNPVAICYLLVGQKQSRLFIDKQKIPQELIDDLLKADVVIKSYDQILPFILKEASSSLFIADPSSCSAVVAKAIGEGLIKQPSIVKDLKAQKNETELNHIRNVMIKDGAALARAFYWLENEIIVNPVSEYDFGEKLIEERKKEEHYIGESFNSIVGYKGNGAIIHYRADKNTCKSIKNEGILLCDSGGQYLDGTTDITRTFAFSPPSEEQKRNYTLVLKGNIALTKSKFPHGTTGIQLDILARQFLWNEGLNYGHGTGHGVGFFLNVHEPPQGIAPGLTERGKTPHVHGMLTSNEPGFYKNGEYGIRLENLVVSLENKDHPGFLSFEVVTLYPFDTTLIDLTIFTDHEKQWLNDYHADVFKKISPLLEGDLYDWFELKCKPI